MSLDIIVPTLGRARLLKMLALNVQRTVLAPYTLLFVVDPDDEETREVVEGLNADMLLAGGTYPEKINAGVKATDGDLVLLANDDVVFHRRWYRKAVTAFKNGVEVVGPNDLSPATENGDHATFPILRRSYIEDPGAAWDEPGTALHGGYHHNFSETELWSLADDRGVAKFVKGCVIEHCHPDWGKADLDETYERGARTNFNADQQLFFERQAAWRK